MVGTTTERAIFEVPAWLPADTEESVVGTQWHQEATGALATMLREVGRRHGTRWGIARGIALLDTGACYPDGKPYDQKPDVMVLARPLPTGDIAGVSLADVGSLPHQAFEREYTLEHELAEAQRRIAEMEAHLRALRGDGTSGESGDVSPP